MYIYYKQFILNLISQNKNESNCFIVFLMMLIAIVQKDYALITFLNNDNLKWQKKHCIYRFHRFDWKSAEKIVQCPVENESRSGSPKKKMKKSFNDFIQMFFMFSSILVLGDPRSSRLGFH